MIVTTSYRDLMLPEISDLDAGLGRLQQHVTQLERELRRTRADYHRLVELDRSQVRTRLPQIGALERLTYQERRVATLAAYGRTNIEVAAELHVTVHTVKSQMGSILRKLELRSRWELDHVLRSSDKG